MANIKVEVEQVQSSKFFCYINWLDLRKPCSSGRRTAFPCTRLPPLKSPVGPQKHLCLWPQGDRPSCQLVCQAFHIWAWWPPQNYVSLWLTLCPCYPPRLSWFCPTGDLNNVPTNDELLGCTCPPGATLANSWGPPGSSGPWRCPGSAQVCCLVLCPKSPGNARLLMGRVLASLPPTPLCL